MHKQHKDFLRTVVATLRATLAGADGTDGTWIRGDLDRELERLGVRPDGSRTELDALPHLSSAERRAHHVANVFISAARGTVAAEAARAEFVERAAYIWINRLLALRTMESRGLIDETLRANPEYDGISEALYLVRQSGSARSFGPDGGLWAVLEDACSSQSSSLPGLFSLDDPAAALRPSVGALQLCVAAIGGPAAIGGLDLADAAFADPDVIGWAYQFYQEAAKQRVYAKLSAGGKASTRAEIAAATQLFTEPYMVQWLLQNSLGRSYHEAYPDSLLPESWEYYIRNRPEGQTTPTVVRLLGELDLIDPCCGSGHFLREAFDMFVAMYRERHPGWSATAIVERVLTRHLHGIDLDPRAAQLAALTLHLRAWELVRAEQRASRRVSTQHGSASYTSPVMNIATTPSGLNAGLLDRHLRRHPEDRVIKPLLSGVFAALEQADILGSLLRPAEHLDAAIAALQQPFQAGLALQEAMEGLQPPSQSRMDMNGDLALRNALTDLATSDPTALRRQLLDRVARTFAADAAENDAADALFGREAEQGVRLIQLLDQKYAVVATNPPYMGNKNMDTPLLKYVEKYYKSGKRDLYSTFILRCYELCQSNGRVSMVTQQSWMFLRSFTELRAIPDERLKQASQKHEFTGVLRETSIEALTHLGRYAFSEISNAAVAPLLFIFRNSEHTLQSTIWCCRLKAPRISSKQDSLLQMAVTKGKISGLVTTPFQNYLLKIPESPIVYWLRNRFFELLQTPSRLRDIAKVKQGLATADNDRFMRCSWEVPVIGQSIAEVIDKNRWFWYAKGGGYQKWSGLLWLTVDWEYSGQRMKIRVDQRTQRPFSNIWMLRETINNFFFKDGLTYTVAAQGSMGVRELNKAIFGHKANLMLAPNQKHGIAALLSTRLASYLLRVTTQTIDFSNEYVANLPLVNKDLSIQEAIGAACVGLKRLTVSNNMLESEYHPSSITFILFLIHTFLHTLEGFNEQSVFTLYNLDALDIQAILDETGVPAGFHPMLSGYDALPLPPVDLNLPPLPADVLDYLARHERIVAEPGDLRRIKANLRALYEVGPTAKDIQQEESANVTDGDDDAADLGAHIPIPTETFLEALAVKLQLHPISVYWLLEELRTEGVRCKPEEKRLLEDRLTVIVLQMLGHRWPRQIEAGEAMPEWADGDGVIPLTAQSGETSLAERLRERLRAEDGAYGAQQTEQLLVELTGHGLDEWLRREFFKRHVRQFKYRPIAWHLASDPSAGDAGIAARGKRKGSGRRQPAFECLLYYHATSGDMLARLRTQYIDPLLRNERQRLEVALRGNKETEAAVAQARIHELEDFAAKLVAVAESGFSSPDLDKLLTTELLDRWSGDGESPPSDHADLLRQERAWTVDLNDGVRVNIAPLQLAKLLASDVIKTVDAKKALVDRARWRADERRWVRDGKLPRCGWMAESVAESPRWTALAPQRTAEQAKLEEKRRVALERSGQDDT